MRDEIVSKLQLLKEYVGFLRSYKKYSPEDIMKDFTLRGAVQNTA